MDESERNYAIERPIYSYNELKLKYEESDSGLSVLDTIKSKVKCPESKIKTVLKSVIPFPFIMASFYTLQFLIFDLVSGITMLVFHIPQGMAYGLLAGLQPINGLYASFIPPLIYFLFGTSRHLSIGTFSIVSILSSVSAIREGTVLFNNMKNDSLNYTSTDFNQSKLQVSIVTTLMAGIFQLIMGFCQFGFLMNYVSDSLIKGFTTATAFHVILSQLDHILGYSVDNYSNVGELPYKLFLFAINIKDCHLTTIGVSVICIIVLLVFSIAVDPIFKKKFKIPFPIQFILIIAGTVISYYGDFSNRLSIQTIGHIPKGLPSIMVPNANMIPKIVVDAFILAIISFIMNSALVKLYAVQFSYDVNFNQELVAYGLSNICGSFFQCSISAGALSRSSVVVQAGMKSQLASIFSCIFMLFVLLFVGPLFKFVPKCILSAIIIVSLQSVMMQFKYLPTLYKLSKYDFNVWVVTFLATFFLNVPIGLAVGFFFSLLTIVIRIQNPKFEILGQLPNTNIYKSIKLFKDAVEICGIKICRYEAPLSFANAELFKSKLYRKAKIKLKKIEPVQEQNNNDKQTENVLPLTENLENKENVVISITEEINKSNYIILDFGSVNYIDDVATRVLTTIESELKSIGISICIAAPNINTRRMLEKAKFIEDHLDDIMFVTVHDAVLSILNKD